MISNYQYFWSNHLTKNNSNTEGDKTVPNQRHYPDQSIVNLGDSFSLTPVTYQNKHQ